MCTSNLTLFKRIPHILSCTFLLSALLLYSYFSVHVLIVLYTLFPKLTRHVKHLPIFHPLLSNRLCLSHFFVLFSIITSNRKRRIKKIEHWAHNTTLKGKVLIDHVIMLNNLCIKNYYYLLHFVLLAFLFILC